jgi:hypothetical protein
MDTGQKGEEKRIRVTDDFSLTKRMTFLYLNTVRSITRSVLSEASILL